MSPKILFQNDPKSVISADFVPAMLAYRTERSSSAGHSLFSMCFKFL